MSRSDKGFLELPVPVVLSVLWVVGAALEVACVVTPHNTASTNGYRQLQEPLVGPMQGVWWHASSPTVEGPPC